MKKISILLLVFFLRSVTLYGQTSYPLVIPININNLKSSDNEIKNLCNPLPDLQCPALLTDMFMITIAHTTNIKGERKQYLLTPSLMIHLSADSTNTCIMFLSYPYTIFQMSEFNVVITITPLKRIFEKRTQPMYIFFSFTFSFPEAFFLLNFLEAKKKIIFTLDYHEGFYAINHEFTSDRYMQSKTPIELAPKDWSKYRIKNVNKFFKKMEYKQR